jgi:hypothetical protein
MNERRVDPENEDETMYAIFRGVFMAAMFLPKRRSESKDRRYDPALPARLSSLDEEAARGRIGSRRD